MITDIFARADDIHKTHMTVSDNSRINRKKLKWDNGGLVWYFGFSSLLFFAPILVHARLQPELIKSIPLCNS